MPVSCPNPSGISCLCIGGQLDTACCDENGEWPVLKVIAELVGTGGQPIIDGSNCAVIAETKVEIEHEGTNGCWCTCALKVNKADDPDLAIQPGGTLWKITVLGSRSATGGIFDVLFGPVEVELDADKVYDDPAIDSDDCCTLSGPCGDCINITCLLPPPPTVPATDRFCGAVYSCLQPIVGAGLLAGGVTGSYEDGWLINLECADIEACLPPLVATTDGTTLGVTQSGTLDHTVDITVTSTDPDQILTIGTDGGSFLSCENVNDCVLIEYVPFDGTVHDAGPVEGDGTAGAPYQVPLPQDLCDAIGALTPAGAAPPTAAQIIAVDNGVCGLYDPPDELNTTYTLVDNGDGTFSLVDDTAAVISTVPICDLLDDLTANAGTVLPTGTQILGSDCQWYDPPASEFEYVDYDDTVHDAGPVEGSGTVADPFQIPLPTEPCAAFDEAALVCDDVVSVLASDGTDCGPVDPCSFAPGHVFGQCTAPGETLVLGTASVTPPNLTMTEIGDGQVGFKVLGGTGGGTALPPPVGTWPLSIPVPAATAGCVLGLHMVWGAWPTLFTGLTVTDNGTGTSNSTAFPGGPITSGGQAGQQVQLFDTTGAAGGTVDISWTTAPEDPDQGVFMWRWVEICPSTGVLTVADLQAGPPATVPTPTVAGPTGDGNDGGESTAYDMGACDVVLFGGARHVASTGTTTNGPADVDWFQENSGGFTEIYDATSYNNGSVCQLGLAAGVLPGGTGSSTFTFAGNSGADSQTGNIADMVSLHLADCGSAAAIMESSTESCSIETCFDSCCGQGVVKCSFTSTFEVTAGPGDVVSAVPVLDGTAYPLQTATVDNTNGADPLTISFPVSFSLTDTATVLSDEDCATHTFAWEAMSTVGAGGSQVTVQGFATECEVIHV